MTDNYGPTTLLVASSGDDLHQLLRLSDRLSPSSGRVTWVTHDHERARALLRGQRVELVPYVPPRGYRNMMGNLPMARGVLRRGYYDRVVGTGEGIALPLLTAARMAGIPCHYVESIERAQGPSPTGRMLRRLPGVHFYTQYPDWTDERWKYRGSLLDGYSVDRLYKFAASRVVVTLGTSPHAFRRAVNRLRGVLPQVVAPGAKILWQLGRTEADGVTGRVVETIHRSELRRAITEADLVIAHADIDAALTALDLGRRPVLLPRSPAFGEDVDDHQMKVAKELGRRGLAIWAEAHELTPDQLRRAQASRVVPADNVEPFELAPAPKSRTVRWPGPSDVLPIP